MASSPSTCTSLLLQRSALSVSNCLEGRGGWLAEWEATQQSGQPDAGTDTATSTFSLLRGWEEVERRSAPRMRKFDESPCLEWDLASLVDTEEASTAGSGSAAHRSEHVQEVRELDELLADEDDKGGGKNGKKGKNKDKGGGKNKGASSSASNATGT